MLFIILFNNSPLTSKPTVPPTSPSDITFTFFAFIFSYEHQRNQFQPRLTNRERLFSQYKVTLSACLRSLLLNCTSLEGPTLTGPVDTHGSCSAHLSEKKTMSWEETVNKNQRRESFP